MKAEASCFGAGTIVNAIATGKGAAFGLALRAAATAEVKPEGFGVLARVPDGVDPTLVRVAAERVLRNRHLRAGLEVFVDSEIPISRGLKSSSAVANAVVLASARALGIELEPFDLIRIGVEAALEAGVTITGAFDDACASFFGGVAVTDNISRKLLAVDRLPEDLSAVIHVPDRTITKQNLAKRDFESIRPRIEEAFRLALRGDFFAAMEANSAAYAPLLGVDEGPAIRARAAGAAAAGITGTGPAIVALAKPARVDAVRKAMDDGTSHVRVVGLNTPPAREAIL
jgi:shikimate kinase